MSPASSNSDGPAGEFAPFAAWNPVYAASVLLGQANSGQVQAGSQVDAIPAGSQTDAIPAGSQADAIPAGSQVDAVSADMINESVASGPGFSLEGAEAAASAGPETTSAGPEMASASAEPETASAAPAPEITPAPSDSRETSAANNLTHSPAPDGATEPASASGSQKQSGANRETQKPSGVRAADPENPGVGAQIAALDFSPIGFSPIGFSPIEGSVPPPEDLTAFASGGTIRLAHGQTAVFPYLPKGVGYTVTEAPADGYTADALGAVGIVGEPTDDGMFNTVIFVNTFDTGVTPPEETVAVSGEKTWVHNGNDPAGYPQSITVNILANGRIVRTYNVTEAKGWRWSAELPKYDAAGNEIIYTVGENPAPGYTSAVNGYNITNTYVGGEPQPTVTISGTKTWIGDSARTDRPGSITVYVLADGAIVKALTVGAGDNWRWSVEMPKYGGNGKEIVYTVGEAAVSGYTSATDGYNLINTFIGKQTPSPGPLPTGGSQGGQTYAPEYPTPGVSPSPTPGAEPTAATATPGPTPEPTPAETLTPSAAPPTATRLTSGGAIEIEVPSKPGSPKTGDEGNSPLWIVFMCVSAAGLISVWAWPRLRRQGKK
ncbi:MAG: Cna B-type domain-containing protein [Firmicutes bacterium]|nr:Cna B-type domain-containing protein [Bacillota bacterium]